MQPRRFPLTALILLLTATLAPFSAANDTLVTGDVKSWFKIGDGEGGFASGLLDDGDSFGFDLTNIGDLNDDGVDDFAVSSHLDDDGGDRRGGLYILFMKASGKVKSVQKISNTQGGFGGSLGNVDWFGTSVTALGDLNNDGVEDIAVGAALDDDGNTNRGAVYILFLNKDGTVKTHTKISDWEGAFYGSLPNFCRFGQSVANIGDIDNDGVIDLAVGASRHNNEGAVWILFMQSNGYVKSYTLIASFTGGYSGQVESNSEFGYSVTGLGDLDGDGVEDVAVGARQGCYGTTAICKLGAVWILFLNTNGTVKAQQKIGGDAGGWTEFLQAYDFFGSGVANLGDLDGDGVVDLAIGCEQDDDGGAGTTADIGTVFIAYLNTDGTIKSSSKISKLYGNFDADLSDGDRFGGGVSGIGDFNDDGVVDVAVGTWNDAGQGIGRGAVYVLMLAHPLNICREVAPPGEIGLAYDLDLEFTGGNPPLVGEISKGKLPAGLALADGMITGTPTKAGKSTFTVKLTDANGQVDDRQFVVKVKKALAWKTKALGDAGHGKEYKQSLDVIGGVGPFYIYDDAEESPPSGNLPDGLEIDNDKGRLFGTPNEVGTFNVTLAVDDELGATATREFTLIVKSTLKVATKSLKKAKAGKAYSQEVKAKGGWLDEKGGDPSGEGGSGSYVFDLSDGALPDGLDLATDGAITGTPTTKGTSVFRVRVTDDAGETAQRELSLKVK